jgi:hypothetical protein
MSAVPEWLLNRVVYDKHDEIRRAALKKRERAVKGQ